jgi:hypothetical protein
MVLHCFDCRTSFPPGYDRCQTCGSQNVGVMVDTIESEGFGVIVPVGLEGMNVKMQNPETGRTSPFLKQYVRREYSPSRKQEEYVVRVFNRLDDTYVERYYDPGTGEIVFEKRGRRSDQSIHGRRGQQSST